jgi:catechol 2,3-dioxygenase-like lactoylglutathione lyase family enzyme
MAVMIGHLGSVVIDCPDPRALADFYCELLGMHIVRDDGSWVTIKTDSDAPSLSFQQVKDLRSPSLAQPVRFDVLVDDIETAEKRAIAAGAQRLPDGDDGTHRVYADPVGNPFSLSF